MINNIKFRQNKENIFPKPPINHQKQNLSFKTNSTPNKQKTKNVEFEVNYEPRSFSFIEGNQNINSKEHNEKACNSKIETQSFSESDSSIDSYNIWQDECQYNDLFDLYTYRYEKAQRKETLYKKTQSQDIIKSYKKLLGMNVEIKNIGFHPFYYNKKENQVKNTLVEQKYNYNQNILKRPIQFKIQENKIPFNKISYLKTQTTVKYLHDKKSNL